MRVSTQVPVGDPQQQILMLPGEIMYFQFMPLHLKWEREIVAQLKSELTTVEHSGNEQETSV